MCFALRKTESRGLCSVPKILFLILVLLFCRASSRIFFWLMALSNSVLWFPVRLGTSLFPGRLADLLHETLAPVPDALLLVDVGTAEGTDPGGRHPHEFLVRAEDLDHRVRLDLRADPVRE